MRGGIDADRQAAGDGKTNIGQVPGEFRGGLFTGGG